MLLTFGYLKNNDAANERKTFSKLNPSVRKIRHENVNAYVEDEVLNFANEAAIFINPLEPYTTCLNGILELAHRSLFKNGEQCYLKFFFLITFGVLQCSLQLK